MCGLCNKARASSFLSITGVLVLTEVGVEGSCWSSTVVGLTIDEIELESRRLVRIEAGVFSAALYV